MTMNELEDSMEPRKGRYAFFTADGEVVLESDLLHLTEATTLGAEFMQDTESGERYDVLPDGPMHLRLRRIGR